MAQADSNTTTPAPIDSSRRRFLTVAAAASAVSVTALAAAAMPVRQACTASQDDSELLELEEQIFAEYEGAAAYDDEIIRLSKIWIAENNRLAHEVDEGRCTLIPQERWDLVTAMPECKEQDRLERLQRPFHERMDAYMEQMFASPAHTAEGRRAKAVVLLRCVMGSDWCHVDAETDYPERLARKLLIEFIGGAPGEQLRGQFA